MILSFKIIWYVVTFNLE